MAALRIDFQNDNGTVVTDQYSGTLTVDGEKFTNPMNFPDLTAYESFFPDIKETEYDGLEVFYSNSKELDKIDPECIKDVLLKAKYFGLESAFDHIFQNSSKFPETSILLIGEKDELEKFADFKK